MAATRRSRLAASRSCGRARTTWRRSSAPASRWSRRSGLMTSCSSRASAVRVVDLYSPAADRRGIADSLRQRDARPDHHCRGPLRRRRHRRRGGRRRRRPVDRGAPPGRARDPAQRRSRRAARPLRHLRPAHRRRRERQLSGMRKQCGGRLLATAVFVSALVLTPRAQSGVAGMREPAWAPDGKRLAVVLFDRIWTVLPDGRDARELTTAVGTEREPAWSPDGKRIAFAADGGDGFDLLVVPARGGAARRVTTMPGDERSPSWTPDGRLVFSRSRRRRQPVGSLRGQRGRSRTRRCRSRSPSPGRRDCSRGCRRTAAGWRLSRIATARTATSISG